MRVKVIVFVIIVGVRVFCKEEMVEFFIVINEYIIMISIIVKLQVMEIVEDVFLFEFFFLLGLLKLRGFSNKKLMMYKSIFFILFFIFIK